MVRTASQGMTRSLLAMLAASAAAVALLIAPSASAAAVAGPKWAITVVPTPTHLVPGSPRSEVDELTVDATGGTYRIKVAKLDHALRSGSLPYDATPEEVETALKSMEISANVTEGASGPQSYRITWTGEWANKYTEPTYEDLAATSDGLTGAGHDARVRTITPGARAGELIVTATNVGDAGTAKRPVVIEATLPSGIKASSVTLVKGYPGAGATNCAALPELRCEFSAELATGDALAMNVKLEVAAGAAAEATVHARVSGGGAESAERSEPITVSEEPAGPGFAAGSLIASASTNQAGAHPDFTTMFMLNTARTNEIVSSPHDMQVDLPRGLVGSAVRMPRCEMGHVEELAINHSACPSDAMVGMARLILSFQPLGDPGVREESLPTPVYNIKPAPGEPAAFAFNAVFGPVRLDTSVLSDGSYGVRVTVPDITEALPVIGTSITIWGVPADHNGPGPDYSLIGSSFNGPARTASMALLSNPSECGEALSSTMATDTWSKPGVFDEQTLPFGKLTGCEQLRFAPSFAMAPETLAAGMPAGYNLNLRVQQPDTAEELAAPYVRNLKLTLPLGTVIDPSAASGLKACSNAEFYGPGHPSEEAAALAACPGQSQVGTVRVKTPALEEALEGDVYLAEPECEGPCTPEDARDGRMVRLFVQFVSEGEGGIVIKLEGHGDINQQTGQITTVFEGEPQLPFSELKLKLTGGERAVLANPRTCGPVGSTLQIASWDEALPEGALSSPLEINQGCFGPQFKPSVAAGMPNIQAGAHGEFTLAFGRTDKDQFLKQITLKMPPGLLGTLKGIPLCGEAQANAGTCGAASLIGEAQVLTGPGADPFLVEGGKVYLTQGYGGSQFGLSIVVPAKAGPYTLGGLNGEGKEADNGLVVVRSQLFIDPHTAQITAVSGPMPSMLDGIPLQLKAVNVKLNRPGFMFNPTSCAKMAITGSIASQEGISANVSEPFQVTNCARLPFEPKLSALTHAHHSKKKGAYLHVVVRSGPGQANIRSVKVELPEALPSVLNTLQHACTEEQFEANPAGCPAESIVGHASAVTPVLPVPLKGPAYFVSHAGKHFPELIVVLQGYGITVDLSGETFISKANVTSSTFKTVPDVPVTRFDLVLPRREYPALDGTTNFCKHPQVMPTRIVGQNGKVVERNTPVEVTGCGTFIAVRHKHVRGDKATILVHTSGAGKLIANGKGISREVKRVSKKGGRVGITVKLKRHLRRKLRHSHRHHVKVRVHLTFKARHGKGKGKATVTVKLK